MRVFSNVRCFKGNFPQILAVFCASLSGISDGIHYGWTAPAIPILQSEDSPVQISHSDIVWLENIFMMGAFSGLPITIFAVDRFGRKNTILISATESLVSWILIGCATSVEYLYVARFLSGLAGDCAFVAAPMYIAEIADQKIRGFLSSMIYLMMLIGILIVYSVVPFVSIPISSIVGGLFLVLQLITFPFMPETPYYLLLLGKQDEARKSLQRFRGTKDVDKELEDILTGVKRQQSERGRPIDLIMVKSNRKALLIMTILNGSQHALGISAMLMNMHTVLQDSASILSASTAAIIFSISMLVTASTASCLIDRFGRKLLLISSSILTGASLAILASYFAVKASGVDIVSHNWIPVVAVIVYGGAFKFGVGMVPTVMTAELFPTSVKAMGMILADFMFTIFAVVSIYLFQVLSDIGMHIPLFIFAGCSVITTLFTIFFIPETKGKTLEEIQHILKGHKSSISA